MITAQRELCDLCDQAVRVSQEAKPLGLYHDPGPLHSPMNLPTIVLSFSDNNVHVTLLDSG